jgi:signal transduction histidine kinase
VRERWHAGAGVPPWWPAGEPWPPPGSRRAHWRGRGRFLRRIGLVFAGLLVLSGIGAATLISRALGQVGGLGGTEWAGLALAFLTFASGVLLFVAAMRRVGFPLGEVVGAADRVARGDYSARVVEAGPPFLRALARAFNSMTARLQEQDRQRRDLLADIAHELRTPLAVVQGRLEGLLDGVYPRDDERLEELLGETRMLARLVADLGTLAHAERGTLGLEKELTDLPLLLSDAARSLAAEADARGVTVHMEEPMDLPLVEVDPLRLRGVLVNVISNAIRHTTEGTAVYVGAEIAGAAIVVRVRDTGPGIAPEDLPRVFDRFQKGAASQGSGLGLAIARSLVAAHGGEMSVASEAGRGTIVTFTIPLSAEKAPPEAVRSPESIF